MIDNLRATTIATRNRLLKTNLAKFTRMLQASALVTSEDAAVGAGAAGRGAAGQITDGAQRAGELGEITRPELHLLAAYAQRSDCPTDPPQHWAGRPGPAEKQRVLLNECTDYTRSIRARAARPERRRLRCCSRRDHGGDRLAALRPLPIPPGVLDQLTQSIGVVLNHIEATVRTENLLQCSS